MAFNHILIKNTQQKQFLHEGKLVNINGFINVQILLFTLENPKLFLTGFADDFFALLSAFFTVAGVMSHWKHTVTTETAFIKLQLVIIKFTLNKIHCACTKRAIGTFIQGT